MGVFLGFSVHQIWTQVVIYATIPGQMWQNFPCAKHTATKFNPEDFFHNYLNWHKNLTSTTKHVQNWTQWKYITKKAEKCLHPPPGVFNQLTLKIDLKIRNLQQGLIGFESFLIKGELPLQISTMLPGTSLSEKDCSEIFLFGRSCAKNKIEIILLTMSKRRTATHVRKWQT